MLPLHDTQVRLVLLGHVTTRLAEARPDELDAAGIGNEQLDRLRQLSALDLNRLAAMRTLTIGISLDGEALQAGLRAVALVKESKDRSYHSGKWHVDGRPLDNGFDHLSDIGQLNPCKTRLIAILVIPRDSAIGPR